MMSKFTRSRAASAFPTMILDLKRHLVFRLLLFFLVCYAWRSFWLGKDIPSFDSTVERRFKHYLDTTISWHTEQLLGHHQTHLIPHARRRKISTIQARLGCYARNGFWSLLSERYHHNGTCIEEWPSLENLELKDLIKLFCQLLSGKRILLVGPHAFHHIQTLLFEALAKHDEKSYSSGYPDSGRHYLVCRDAQKAQDPSFNLTHISFSLSDTLFPIQGDDEINGPEVDPRTGVRVHNSYWFKELWKTQLLILNKGPIPAPASTYDGGTGNWSFIRQANEAGEEDNLSARIVKAAFDIIFQVYIPQLLHTLNVLEGTKSNTVFFGPWFQQSICTNSGLNAKFRTTKLFWEPYDQVDPWSLYYNTQGRGLYVCFGPIALANCYQCIS